MKVKKYWKKLPVILLASALLLSYPFLLFIVLVVSFYRYVVQTIVKQDPKSGNILSGMDACAAGKENPCLKPVSTIVLIYTLSSKVDKHEVMRVFTEKILKPKDNGGKCVYPEMTQKIVKKYGYWFWYKNDNFTLEDHIKYVNEENPDAPMTRKEMLDYVAYDVLKTPFNPNGSPWELLLVRNLVDPEDPNAKSSILFKHNHCLSDGYSSMSFMQKVAVKPWTDLGGTPKSPKLSKFEEFVQLSQLLLTGPYHFIKFALLTNDDNKWINTSIREFKSVLNYHETKLIPMSKLKNINRHFNVTLTSVLYTALAEAARQVMEKKNVAPSKIHMNFPFLVPGHPDKLTNHWTPTNIPVRFHKNDLKKTLLYVESQYRKLQRSVLPLANWYASKFCGLLPVPFIPNTDSIISGTFLLTNFPGPAHLFDMFGYEVTDFNCAGTHAPGFAIYVALLSYNGYLRINVAGDISIFPEKKDTEDVVKTLDNILNRWEFEIEKRKD